MSELDQRMDWFKIHHSGWLEGTLRSNPDINGDKLAGYRGIMADLLALVSRSRLRDGTLRRQIGLPMERSWIANTLNISVELLNKFIEFGEKDINPNTNTPMVKEWEDGTLELTGWVRYQAKTGRSVKQQDKETISLDSEHKEMQGKVMAYKSAKKYPDDAEKGVKAARFEKTIKKSTI